MTPEEVDAEIALNFSRLDQIRATVRDHLPKDPRTALIVELIDLVDRVLYAWQLDRQGKL